MRVPKFELLQPGSLTKACDLAKAAGPEGQLLAGGTDLLPLMKLRGIVPRQVINLKSIDELYQVEAEHDGLSIGSLVELDVLEDNPAVTADYPMLAAAVGEVASYQLRNMGTIGGNVCLDSKCWYYNQSHQWWKARDLCFKRGGNCCYVVKGGDRCYAISCADTVPALIAMEAQLKVSNSNSERWIAVEDFFTGEGRSVNLLQPGDILTEIRVPAQPDDSGWSYIKLSPRGALDYALVDVAVRLRLSADGTCNEARIALNAVAPQPLRAASAEQVLIGQPLSAEVIQLAAEKAAADAKPLSSIRASVYYRRRIIKVLTQRALTQAGERAVKGGEAR